MLRQQQRNDTLLLLPLGVRRFVLLLLHTTLFLTTLLCPTTTNAIQLDCNPCIRRSEYVIKAIVHGTKSDGFWNVVEAAMNQAGRDMGIQLQLQLYDEFSPDIMANDIRKAVTGGSGVEVPTPDALIVTIPSKEVEDAIQFAIENSDIPIFGLNSGYDVATDLGLLGFVAQHEYLAGVEAANEFQRQKVEEGRTIRNPLFLNHQKGNTAMDDRFRGFNDTLTQLLYNNNQSGGGFAAAKEMVIDPTDLLRLDATLDQVFGINCYDTVLVGTAWLAPFVIQAAQRHGCMNGGSTKIGTFDQDDFVNRAIIQGKLAFAMSQQRYLQGVLSVVMASIYVTTGKKLALPLDYSGIYLSGPNIINQNNLPTDTQTLCEAEAYPICSNQFALGNNSSTNGMMMMKCPCLDRSTIRIAGVLHGVTTDQFWDPVFAVAKQTAQDLGIELHLDRLQPETNNTVLYQKMASRIKSECEAGVNGIFVTIPSSKAVMDAIKICQILNVPIVGVNSAPDLSQQLGITTHIGQDDYSAGYEAGRRLIQAGMVEGHCMNHEEGNTGMTARCKGFGDAILAANSDSESPKVEVTYGGMIIVPQDLDAEFQVRVEAAVGKGGDWEGVGFLLTGGIVQVEPAMDVQKHHPKVLLGTFDVNDVMYPLLEDGRLQFTFDQQPYLQGAWPVHLLTYTAYTQQHLLNNIVQTGPNAVLAPPTEAEQICQTNLYRTCSLVPPENFNYIAPGWLGIGYTLLALIVLMGLACLFWLHRNRDTLIVKASQPPFLILLVLGTMISGLAIIPMGVETAYRTIKDPYSGYYDDNETNPDIARVDAACMAVPWLYGVGFALIFSALFAKIFRVTLIYKAGKKMIRRRVGYQHVMFILVIMLAVELILLLSWQLVSPLRWEREVTLVGSGGHTLESVGRCHSESGWYFMGALLGFHILSLFYAMVLCWQAKHIPSEYAESNWVFLSVVCIFQVSVIATPIAVMVQDETEVLYFIRASAIFLQTFMVLVFMFAPKMYRVLEGDDHLRSLNGINVKSKSNSINSRISNPDLLLLSSDGGFSSCCKAEISTVCTCCGCYVRTDGKKMTDESVQLLENRTGLQPVLEPEGRTSASERALRAHVQGRDQPSSSSIPMLTDSTCEVDKA